MRRSTLLGGVLVAAVALTACTAAKDSDSNQDDTKPGYVAFADTALTSTGTLTAQVDYDSAEPNGLDPATADTARSWSIMSLVYEPLVTIGPTFKVEPRLASFAQSDATTYTFTLTPGVTFSNGREVTTDDVVGSLKRLLASKSPYSAQLGPVKSIEATGPDRVTVMLDEVYTPFLAALANTPAAILPMKEIEDGSLDVTKEMLGTGPYVVTDHRQDESWTFDANPKYRDASRLKVTKLQLEIVPDESSRLAAVRDGSAGFALFNNVDTLDLLGGTTRAAVVNQRNSDFYYMMINAKSGNPVLKDRDVRFAINAALDRAKIAEVAFAGKAEPTAITPSVLPDACKADDVPSAAVSDTDAAKAVDEAGAKGASLRLAVYASEPAAGQLAQVVQQQLKKAGVDVTINEYDDATLGEKVYGPKPDFDLAISWFAGYVDPSMVSRWWNPDVALFDAAFLDSDPELNTMISAASAMQSGPERAAALQEMCDKADQNSGMLALVTRPTVIGFRKDKVSPTLYADEGYGNILRDITSFRLQGAK